MARGAGACDGMGNYSEPTSVSGIWLAGGAPTPHTLPPGGSIVLCEEVGKEKFDEHMQDLVAAILAHLEQARDELRYSGILVEGPIALVPHDEVVCRQLESDRRKHFGFSLGRHFTTGAMAGNRLYAHNSYAIDLIGIRPDTLKEIAIEIGALFAEPGVLLLDRARKKSVLLVTGHIDPGA